MKFDKNSETRCKPLACDGRYGPSNIYRSLFLIASIGLFPSVVSAQVLPKAPNSEVITVTPMAGSFNEPSIAINPNNPQQIVAAYQGNARVAYSPDAGRHWLFTTGIESKNYRVSGDVSITYDNQGHAYICYITFDKLGTRNYWGHNSSRNGI